MSRSNEVSARRPSSVIGKSMNGLQPEVTQQTQSLSGYTNGHSTNCLISEVNNTLLDDVTSVSRHSADQLHRRAARDQSGLGVSSSPKFHNALRNDVVTNSDRSNNSVQRREHDEPMASREPIDQSLSSIHRARNTRVIDDERLRGATSSSSNTARTTEWTGDRQQGGRLGHLPA